MQEHEFTTRLMGCDTMVSIVSASRARAETAYAHALTLGRDYEARFTRFHDDSELSRLNRERKASISPLFMDALLHARELYLETSGVFNVLLQVRSLGYTTDFTSMDKDTVGDSAIYNTNFMEVAIDGDTNTVSLSPGQQLDFGGFIKGHTAEVMARSVSDASGVVVNIGGDIYAHGLDVEGAPFRFSVYDPLIDSYPFAIPAERGAVATSGTYRRAWQRNAKMVHHILDRSGRENPDSDIISATVAHPVGYVADAYATVAVALGSDAARTFLSDRGRTFALITKDGSRITSPDL
ncbi:MAG: FAD:protein FMN transferase [Candidatus Pacebacteria bacterium]|nr:FAD:protein FMN transferase [Candidatus Paceibacterota bacterium]